MLKSGLGVLCLSFCLPLRLSGNFGTGAPPAPRARSLKMAGGAVFRALRVCPPDPHSFSCFSGPFEAEDCDDSSTRPFNVVPEPVKAVGD
jgi:hypothetical protein